MSTRPLKRIHFSVRTRYTVSYRVVGRPVKDGGGGTKTEVKWDLTPVTKGLTHGDSCGELQKRRDKGVGFLFLQHYPSIRERSLLIKYQDVE